MSNAMCPGTATATRCTVYADALYSHTVLLICVMTDVIGWEMTDDCHTIQLINGLHITVSCHLCDTVLIDTYSVDCPV